MTPDHCPDNTAGCVFTATSVSGSRGERYVTGCIDGSSFQGPWDSCDYYAVVPHCEGNPTLTLDHERVGHDTLVKYEGRDWDVADCGAVTISDTSGQGSPAIATESRSNFSGEFTLKGHRVCGVTLVASQAPPNRSVQAHWTDGRPLPLSIVLAQPGSTPDGDPLVSGDVLCEDDVPPDVAAHARAGKIGPGDVATIASALGQQLLELYVQGAGANYVMSDPTSKVGVVGLSIQGASAGLFEAVQDELDSNSLLQTVASPTPATTANGDVLLSGESIVPGPLIIPGNLNIQDGILYVQGDLQVGGSILGRGTIYATGSITAAGADLWGLEQTDESGYHQTALVALGDLDLP